MMIAPLPESGTCTLLLSSLCRNANCDECIPLQRALLNLHSHYNFPQTKQKNTQQRMKLFQNNLQQFKAPPTMTWTAFYNAMRSGIVQRSSCSSNCATTTRRTMATPQSASRSTITTPVRNAATRSRTSSAQSPPVPHKKSIEDWDYHCIDLTLAWH